MANFNGVSMIVSAHTVIRNSGINPHEKEDPPVDWKFWKDFGFCLLSFVGMVGLIALLMWVDS